ncbi:MAG: hypothetical protein V1661_03145 [bacterium]
MKKESAEECRNRLEKFMREAAKRVRRWPKWKQNVGLTDYGRQYNRYEPVPISNKSPDI